MNNSIERKHRRTTRDSLNKRNEYLELLERVQQLENSGDVSLKAAQDVGAIIREANAKFEQCTLSDNISESDTTFIDSQILSKASSILVKCLEAVDVGTDTYEPNEFAARICDLMGDNDHLIFYEEASSLISNLPDYYTLYGAVQPTREITPKTRVVAQKDNDKELIRKEPQKVVHGTTSNDEENVEYIIEMIRKVLVKEYERSGNRSIDYYRFVVDTSSFSSTVYNMFYTSFLIQKGVAKMDVDKDGSVTIEPANDEQLEEFRSSGGTNIQMISSITKDEWRKFNYTEGLLQKHNKK